MNEFFQKRKRLLLLLLLITFSGSTAVIVFKVVRPPIAKGGRPSPNSLSLEGRGQGEGGSGGEGDIASRISDISSVPGDGINPHSGRRSSGEESILQSAALNDRKSNLPQDDFASSSLAFIGKGSEGSQSDSVGLPRSVIATTAEGRGKQSHKGDSAASSGSDQNDMMNFIGKPGSTGQKQGSEKITQGGGLSSQSGQSNATQAGSYSSAGGKMARSKETGKSSGQINMYRRDTQGRAVYELERRRDIALQSQGGTGGGSFANADVAAGAVNAALGATPGQGTTASGNSGGATVQTAGRIPSLPSEDSITTSGPGTRASGGDNIGWSFQWHPRIISNPPGLSCENARYWAKNAVQSKWEQWYSKVNAGNAFADNRDAGHLGTMRNDIEKITRSFNEDGRNLWDQILSVFNPQRYDACQSFYSDVDIAMQHQTFGSHQLEHCVENAAAPPPYVLGRALPSGANAQQGFETVLPATLDPSSQWLPDVAPVVTVGGAQLPATARSACYEGSANYPQCAEAEPSGIVKKTVHIGFGIFRLTYCFCVNCGTDHHDSYFCPSVYFNVIRPFTKTNGNDLYSGRCLPASAPWAAPVVSCSIAGNCEMVKKCSGQSLRSLLNDPGFRTFAQRDDHKNNTIEEICDKWQNNGQGIQSKVQACVDGCVNASALNTSNLGQILDPRQCNPGDYGFDSNVWDSANMRCSQ